MKGEHPTRHALITAAVDLLRDHGPDQVTSDMVLAASGISRGSLYHHFRDFPDLMDHAQIHGFAQVVDRSIEMLNAALGAAQDKEDFFQRICAVTVNTQSADARPIRERRVWVMGQSVARPAFRKLLSAEQQRLTDAITALTAGAQAKGWYRSDLDPQVIAVFIQAYTVGKYVDDIVPDSMNQQHWDDFINTVIRKVMMAD